MVGSAHLFSDQYLDKEENGKLQDVVFQWLTSDDIPLNPIDAEDPEVGHPSGGREDPAPDRQCSSCRCQTTTSCLTLAEQLRSLEPAFRRERR